MTPEIRRLTQAYRDAVDEFNSVDLAQQRPDIRRAAGREINRTARDVAAAVATLLDEEPMEEPGLVRALRVEIVDLTEGARQLYGENAALIAGRPLPPHDFRYVLVGQSARTTIHAGAAVSAEFLVQYETARMAERGLQLCGCLINDGGAHRVGCPSHPEGVKGDRL